ncbi:MAG: Holliday junction DNA helicase RuvA [Desulfamplus sp.]|nr:Holliday junction DNA helicase RuvA [Desulfamplus sp.]
MIAYMEGKLLKMNRDGILLLAGYIGYEILLPVFVMEKLVSQLSDADNPPSESPSDRQISLYIYYYQTDRQPKPVLIGFHSEEEKDFFEIFISVDAIGPLKAVKAMEKSISLIASAIEQQDIDFLATLKGIGKRTAQKIVASLHGKVARFISESVTDSKNYSGNSTTSNSGDSLIAAYTLESSRAVLSISMQKLYQQVVDVLIDQLGYTGAIAKKMVSMAMEKNPLISTPEELFEAVLHGKL